MDFFGHDLNGWSLGIVDLSLKSHVIFRVMPFPSSPCNYNQPSSHQKTNLYDKEQSSQYPLWDQTQHVQKGRTHRDENQQPLREIGDTLLDNTFNIHLLLPLILLFWIRTSAYNTQGRRMKRCLRNQSIR